MNPLQEYDFKLMSENHPVPKLMAEIKKVILDSFIAGEQCIIDSSISEAYEALHFTTMMRKHKLAVEKCQKNMSRIIYEQYLEKLIKDVTCKIFQENPSLP